MLPWPSEVPARWRAPSDPHTPRDRSGAAMPAQPWVPPPFPWPSSAVIYSQ